VYGYIDITTPTALSYSDLLSLTPDAGGQLLLAGAANARALMMMIAGNNALLELDLDNDNVYEVSGELPWHVVIVAGTNPDDTDGDGIPDSGEQSWGMDPEDYSDSGGDIDSDGLTNFGEYEADTSPFISDTDTDGIPDGWEVDHSLDPLVDDTAGDADSDGLTNGDEFIRGTNPQSSDTDADGMDDGWEVTYSLDPLVNDANGDADSDGLTNGDEYTRGTNPQNSDTDADGLPDGWEVDHSLDPLVDDTGIDADSDGLTNGDEFTLGTDPQSPDTDTDGMDDGWEVTYSLDPLVNDANGDADSDGLTNGDEFTRGTNPQSSDTDTDGMPDGWEVTYALDPLVDDANQNPDGDGKTNLEEFITGSDPGFPADWLSFRIIDAEYSASRESIVMVAEAPSRLYLYNTNTEVQSQVDLPLTPMAVSVSPDGLFAAVGHDGWVSYVDLSTESLVNTFAVSTNVYDVVLDGNGFIHAFPLTDQWERIRTIEIATGIETLHTGNSIYDETRARLHPDGSSIYGANNGLSPSDIEKYDVSVNPVNYLYDSPYHGDFAMCGDLWHSEDGLRIFTRCGNVFRASVIQGEDMQYNGSLDMAGQVSFVDHSLEAGLVAAIPYSWSDANADIDLLLFDDDYLTLNHSITLPEFTAGKTRYPSHGKFVFFSENGTRHFVIVQGDPASGMLYDYAILSFDTSPANNDIDADGMPNEWERLHNLDPLIPTDAILDPDGDGQTNLEEFLAGTDPNFSGDPSFPAEWLSFRVIDAEYSNSLESIVMVAKTPSRLHLYNTNTDAQSQVDLPLTPTAVSVSPDGLFAAVGHDGWISYVDLSTESLLDTFAVSTIVNDVVLDGNGFIHAFPLTDQWERIRTIEIATRIETLHTGNFIRAGTRARLHPNGSWIYGADNGSSPSDIEKYDVSVNPVNYLYDSPYHGDYQMCGDLWHSEDGLRIFTRCGNVFRASVIQSEDMQYNGSLDMAGQVGFVDHSLEAGLVAAIPYSWSDANADTVLSLFDYNFLTFSSSMTLPSVTVEAADYPTHGKFVFFNDDGSQYFAILHVDPAAGLGNDYAIAFYP
jgi:hypothetical protein